MDDETGEQSRLLELVLELNSAYNEADYERVRVLASQIVAIEPENGLARYAYAAALYQQKDKDAFLEAVQEGVIAVGSSQEEKADLLALKALGLAGLGDYEAAISAGREALEVDPEEGDAWLSIALAAGQIDDTEQSFEAAKRAAASSESEVAMDTLWHAATAAGDFAQALNAADSLISMDGDAAGAHAYRAVALSNLERPEEALMAADLAYDLDPNSGQVLRARSNIAASNGDIEKAKRTLEGWLDHDPSAAEAWTALAKLHMRESEWEQAIAGFRKGRQLDEDDPEISGLLAAALTEVGDTAEALTIFTELTVTDPEDEAAWLGRSTAERLLGLADAALASAQTGLSLGRFASAQAWMELAHSYSSAGRHDNAWRAFRKAAAMDGSSVEAALGVAVESLRCNNEARALSELSEAEDRTGPDSVIEFNRGVAFYRLGKESLARDAWTKARKISPELGAVDLLISSVTSEALSGSWSNHWFGKGADRGRKAAGLLLLVLLLISLALPFLEPGLIPGLETGKQSLEAFLPSLVLALLILFPAIRGLAVGGVSVDVAPIAIDQKVKLDPSQLLPAFRQEEIDVSRLILR
jgi:tetratricopeptide (TPR) repeat protein